MIRLEGSAYGGRILTVDTRSDVERAALSSLHGLSQIADVITLSSSIVGHEPKSIEDICRAADSLRADLVLIYTVGATSTFDELSLGPIDILTMGVLPTRAHTVRVAAIASLIDVPSATLIGTAHVHEEVSQHGNFWTEEQACRSALRRAEADALRRLFESFEREAWPDVLATYARR